MARHPVQHSWQTASMSQLITQAPSPVDAPIAVGTLVRIDPESKFLDRDYLTGGAPWKLLRLPGGSKSVAESWVNGARILPGQERFARTLINQGMLHPIYESRVDVDQIDVVIPVYNDISRVSRLLTMLRDFHVTIVDDASSNPSLLAEIVSTFNQSLVRLEENVGPGGARNAGLRATSRPFIWFIDDDITVDAALNVASRLFCQFSDPMISCVTPRVRGTDGNSLRDKFELRFSPLDMGARSQIVVPGGPVGYVPSACMMLRRSAVGAGFDPSLRIGEDVDLVWRLHDQGWLVRYIADVVVTHRARTSWSAWWHQRVQYGISSAELSKRHPGRLAPLRADPWTLLAWATVFIGRPSLGARIISVNSDALKERIEDSADEPDHVAREVVAKGMLKSGGPLARAIVRTFGPLLLLFALHPKLRRRVLALFVFGTAWRWRKTRLHPLDVPVAIADDVAYSVGVVKGAVKSRSLATMTPDITKSSVTLRKVLGISVQKN